MLQKTDLRRGHEPACSRINQLADRMFVHPAKKRFNSTYYSSLGRIVKFKMKNHDPKVSTKKISSSKATTVPYRIIFSEYGISCINKHFQFVPLHFLFLSLLLRGYTFFTVSWNKNPNMAARQETSDTLFGNLFDNEKTQGEEANHPLFYL